MNLRHLTAGAVEEYRNETDRYVEDLARDFMAVDLAMSVKTFRLMEKGTYK